MPTRLHLRDLIAMICVNCTMDGELFSRNIRPRTTCRGNRVDRKSQQAARPHGRVQRKCPSIYRYSAITHNHRQAHVILEFEEYIWKACSDAVDGDGRKVDVHFCPTTEFECRFDL
jgi:hypothetical protein